MKPEIINCFNYEQKLLTELKSKVEQLQSKHNIQPTLATILVGEDSASQIYVRTKTKIAQSLGIATKGFKLPSYIDKDSVLDIIDSLNRDDSVNGILVQLPLPSHLDSEIITNSIFPSKDVDGLNSINLGLLATGSPEAIWPCTPLGIMYVLNQEIKLKGKEVLIIGRSKLVGLPIGLLALQANATVTFAHSHSRDLSSLTKNADIIIVAAGRSELIVSESLKAGAFVVDVGINRVPCAESSKGYKVMGDLKVDEKFPQNVRITPVPGGVGRLTVACLMYNTYRVALKQHNLLASNLTIGGLYD